MIPRQFLPPFLMKKILLTAVLVLFSTSSVAHAQLSPAPDPGPGGDIDAIQNNCQSILLDIRRVDEEISPQREAVRKAEKNLNERKEITEIMQKNYDAAVKSGDQQKIESAQKLLKIALEMLDIAQNRFNTEYDKLQPLILRRSELEKLYYSNGCDHNG